MSSPRLLAAVLVCVLTAPAAADDVIPGHSVDRPTTGLAIGGALVAALGLSLIPVHVPAGLWQHELFGAADESVRDSFSRRAVQLSDGLVIASAVAPVMYLTGATIEDADRDRLLIYGESLAVNLALFEGAKHLVQRPRPYAYAQGPAAKDYTAGQGDDAYQSFYSGHSATAFCAATAGAYLASASSTSRGVRALAWSSGFALAAATANLRVRAGKHFYSDIVIGGLVGVAVGYAVPALHADGKPYVPDIAELGAALAGVVGGGLVSELLPLEHRRDDSLTVGRFARIANLHLAPLTVAGGSGLALGGTLR